MNKTLSLLNATALVALVAFHFQGDGNEQEKVSVQAQPHHLMRQAPQLAVMTHELPNKAFLANDSGDADATQINQTQRWTF